MFGDVFIAQFPFTSGDISRPRPVLVLFDLQADVLICRITSVPRSGPLDVALHDWQQAGLALPSVARLDRLVTAEKSVIGRWRSAVALKPVCSRGAGFGGPCRSLGIPCRIEHHSQEHKRHSNKKNRR